MMPFFFCYGDEENGHRACTKGYLTTANQSEIRKAYLVSANCFDFTKSVEENASMLYNKSIELQLNGGIKINGTY